MAFISPAEANDIESGTNPDLFSILGLHYWKGKPTHRVFVPGAKSVDVIDKISGRLLVSLVSVPVVRGLFAGPAGNYAKDAYQLRISNGGNAWIIEDPYRFGPVLGELDEHLIGEGSHHRLWDILGANIITHEGVEGTHFAVWAPNARRVSVVLDGNGWDGRVHVMRKRGSTGVWEIFIPGIGEGEAYKYELLDQNGSLLPQKADPFGLGSEHPPKTASVIRQLKGYQWRDQGWMSKRQKVQAIDQPISIYEVHLGSWKRISKEGNRPLSYLEHASQLVAYASEMGFTHIELMPISEFPFDGSWGYQPIGLYAPSIRYGTLEEFRNFVEACHDADIGLLLDWVPGHFPEDKHGLGRFDGTPLYEHADRKEGFHPDWNTLVYNFGRREVVNYLSSNALYWLNEHHVDGLRVDAVSRLFSQGRRMGAQ
jgi:1,4-alpha-glucan branching enzyme